MNMSAERQRSIHHQFDAFCKKSMRYEARNCYKEISRKQQREVSLDYLIEEHFFAPRSVGDYFIVQPMQDISTSFRINGQIVTVENDYLAAALLHLSAEKRELILLHYFLGLTMQDIAALYNRAHNTISHRKYRALKLLREEMERLKYEEE